MATNETTRTGTERHRHPAAGVFAEEASGQMPVPENHDDVLRSEEGKERDRRTTRQPTGVSDRKTPD